jgi:MSHA biogenesis protein MshQ
VLSPTVSQTVTFSASDAGRKSIPFTITKAYRDLRCRVTDPNQLPTVVGCSSDNFAVRPVEFVISSNANADIAGLSNTNSPTFTAGGTAFTINVSSVAGYNGTPLIDQTRYNVRNNMHTMGTLTGNFSAANSANGNASGTNFKYSEVGYFKFMRAGVYDDTFTAIDSANGDCVGTMDPSGGLYPCRIFNESSTDYFGRFIPDHFAITSSMSTNTCGTFNYYGQDGVSTTFVLSAQNSSNAVTQNYTGAFAKLPLNAWSSTTGFKFAATGLTSGTLSSGSIAPTGSWTNGVATVTAMHQVARLTTPMNPATVSITAQPTDSDGVTMSSATLASNIPFRYGRIGLKNAYGSELHNLTIPIEAQYWDGTTYRRNTLDNCTNTTTPNITLSNYKKNLSAGETTLSGGGLMNQGKSSFTLSKPGAGNSGTVDLSFSLTNFPWMGTGNLAARATFGLYKTPIIYMRENF